MRGTFVVIGGGIAGVSCAETLAVLQPQEPIILISESSLIKTAVNLNAITRTLTGFDVKEAPSESLSDRFPNITVVNGQVTEIDDDNRIVMVTGATTRVEYKILCLCMGANPKLIPQGLNTGKVIGIRDTDSVDSFVEKLKNCTRIAIVGNGGIASEVVFKISNVEVDWVIKDQHISATFIDPGAAEFFQDSLNNPPRGEAPVTKRMRFKDGPQSGAALGPDWYKSLIIKGSSASRKINVHYQAEIVKINETQEGPMDVLLNTGATLRVDLIISATGVTPIGVPTKPKLELSEDGGIQVNELMQTSSPNIYAAGDICTPNWPFAKHWFPMKLWTQARQMGCFAAKSMVGHLREEPLLQDFCFELFAHSTKLFGYKVILLGLYNGQKLGQNYEILLRMTKNKEYIKFVLEDKKLQGAVLIGETDLEEMCENLILNQLDLEPFGDNILNPDIDIEDYFD